MTPTYSLLLFLVLAIFLFCYILTTWVWFKVDERNKKQTKLQLRKYQEFISQILDYKSPHREMLLYHGLGTGKTCSAIGVAEEMRSYLLQMNMVYMLNQIQK